MDRQKPPNGDYKKPLPKQKPFPFLPEREWLDGRIDKVEYEYVYFKGQMQYLLNKDKEPVIDAETQEQIPRRQFNIMILLNNYQLPNGEPRRVWIKLGASLGGKAHLPQFLLNMGMGELNPTPQDIIDFLQDMDVKLQLATKKSETGGNDYQQVIWDSVKPLEG